MLRQHGHAVHVGQSQVEDHDVRPHRCRLVKPVFSVRRFDNVKAFGLQGKTQDAPDLDLVVDNQYFCRSGHYPASPEENGCAGRR